MALHHEGGEVCPLCEGKLGTAHPYLQDWYHQVKKKYVNTHISWAFRGEQDQEQAFSDGKTHLHWPDSPHNKVPALALDLFQIDDDNVARWSPQFFARLNQDNEEAHEPIVWGGVWKTLGDGDHFQYQV